MSASRGLGQKQKGKLPDLNNPALLHFSQSESPGPPPTSPPSPPPNFNLDLIWPSNVPRSMLTTISHAENAVASSSKVQLRCSPKNLEPNMLKTSTFLGVIDLTETSDRDVSNFKSPQARQFIDLTDNASDDELHVVDLTCRHLKRKHKAVFGDVIDISD